MIFYGSLAVHDFHILALVTPVNFNFAQNSVFMGLSTIKDLITFITPLSMFIYLITVLMNLPSHSTIFTTHKKFVE